jgi:hypothetical protein
MDLKLAPKHLWTVPFPRPDRDTVPERKFGCHLCKSEIKQAADAEICPECLSACCGQACGLRHYNGFPWQYRRWVCRHEHWLQHIKRNKWPNNLYFGPVLGTLSAPDTLTRRPFMFDRLWKAGYLTEDVCSGMSMPLTWAKKLILDGTIPVGSKAWQNVLQTVDKAIPAFHASLLLADPTMTKPNCYDTETWTRICAVVDSSRQQRERDIAASIGASVYLAGLIVTYL